MRFYHEGTKVELKADQSPVTQADKASEAIVLGALHRLAPDVPVVSEEIATDRTAPLGASFFLVDPLDGTKEFIQKRSDFTVNIALVENGSPRFGLVYAPARSLLATTPASGKAIEVTVEPSERGADLSALDCRTLHVLLLESPQHLLPTGVSPLPRHLVISPCRVMLQRNTSELVGRKLSFDRPTP